MPETKCNGLGSQTLGELRELQRLTFSAVRYPLSPARALQKRWTDGRLMRDVCAEFIKPNDRLSSAERIEIYSKSYWFRVLDCLYDDYPGLLAILGEKKFYKLRIAYLTRYPSRSFTLRDLGSLLVQFIAEEPQWTAPHHRIALDMARFEWAQVEAFDGASLPSFTPDELRMANPSRLKLGLQPYITLLDLAYPLDDFVIAVKKQNTALRSEASNAIDEERPAQKSRAVRLPKPRQTFLAVHRYENELWYKRLPVEAYKLLTSLRDGATLEAAIDSAGIDPDTNANWGADLQEWFKIWMELGWFCKGAVEPRRPKAAASPRQK